MPVFFIRTVNQTFEVRDDGSHYQSLDSARTRAIDAACDIVTDEIRGGAGQSTVSSYVEDAAENCLAGIRLNISLDDIGPPQ